MTERLDPFGSRRTTLYVPSHAANPLPIEPWRDTTTGAAPSTVVLPLGFGNANAAQIGEQELAR